MKKYLKSEQLKQKRTVVSYLLWGIPLVFGIFAFALAQLMSGTGNEPFFMAVVYNWFPLFFMPIIIGLLASQAMTIDEQHRCEEHLQTLPSDRRYLYSSKFIVNAVNLGWIQLAVFLITCLLEYFFLQEQVAYGAMLGCSIASWVCLLPVLEVSLWFRKKTSTVLTLCLNVLLMFVGVLMAPTTWWWVNPWSYVARLTAALLGIHPNGILLPAGDPLFATRNAIAPLLLSFGLLVVLTTGLIGIETRKRGEKHVDGHSSRI